MTAAGTPSPTQPLAGIRVLDFSRLLPGPYATLVLADLGADVIKVEAPKGGDYLRWMPPLTAGASQKSYQFAALNTGKRSLAVDLKRPDGAAVVRALADRADVVVESFRPGVMARLGLGYEALRATNPRLIYCAISGFGQDGPYADRPGHDLNYAALAGAMGIAGPASGTPAVPPVQMADFGGSLWGLVAILTALYAREGSGQGTFLDVSMTDGALGFLTATLAPLVGGGATAAAPRGTDTLTGGQACYQIYETADGGHLSVAPLEPKFWAAFCEALGRLDLQRRQFGDPTLEGELRALFLTRTRAEWVAVFDTAGACVEPVLRPEEVAEHPLHVARGNVIADTEGLRRLRTPVRPRGAPSPTPAPRLGEHTAEILAELGYDDARVDALVKQRAILRG